MIESPKYRGYLYGKINLKTFPTTPFIEGHSYGNERIWNKIAPLKEVPHL